MTETQILQEQERVREIRDPEMCEKKWRLRLTVPRALPLLKLTRSLLDHNTSRISAQMRQPHGVAEFQEANRTIQPAVQNPEEWLRGLRFCGKGQTSDLMTPSTPKRS